MYVCVCSSHPEDMLVICIDVLAGFKMQSVLSLTLSSKPDLICAGEGGGGGDGWG